MRDVDYLRTVARWAGSVDESLWSPAPGVYATVEQVFVLFHLCQTHQVCDPEDLPLTVLVGWMDNRERS